MNHRKAIGRIMAERGIKKRDIDDFITGCFKVGVNPCPHIRQIFFPFEVGFTFVGAHFPSVEEGGVHIIVKKNEDQGWMEINF